MQAPTDEFPTTGAGWRRLRERAGLTRTELASRTGLNIATLRTLETTGHASTSTCRLVALVLGAALGLTTLERTEP